MNRTSKILTGALSGVALAMVLRNLGSRKTKIEKRGKQLSNAIDEKLLADKQILEETRDMLEVQLEKVNAEIEKLAGDVPA